MRHGSIAKRYATALLSVAKEEGKLDAYLDQLISISQQFSASGVFKNTMISPIIKPTEKQAIIAALAPKLGLSASLVNLLNILIDNDRMDILPILQLLYRDMADEEGGKVRVEIKSATALGANEEKLRVILEKSLGQKVIIETKVEPELLGGLIVRVKDRVFDASLKNELERMKQAIVMQAVA